MAYTLISSVDQNNAGSVNLTNIPQTYRTLILDITISQSSAGSFGLRFNDNTSSVYNFAQSSTWGSSRGFATSAITLTNNMPSNTFARFLIKIPNYVGANGHGLSWIFGAPSYQGGMGTASFSSAAAITTINVAPSGNGTFSYDLWGLS